MPGVTDSVFASDGSLWVLAAKVIRHLTLEGAEIGSAITDVPDATALSLGSNGRLLVCDNGPRQQVLFYDVSQAPKLTGAFGIQGGLASGVPGQTAPQKLFGLRGAGTDAAGNLTVAMGITPDTGGGCMLRSFTPAGTLR